MAGIATPRMNEQIGVILDNIDRRSNVMPRTPTKTCPVCNGEKVVPGRYTEPAGIACSTCDGTGVVPADSELAQAVEDEGSAAKPKEDAGG